ncbi:MULTISPECIES: ABC transporter substrate-binding protein [unclassified Butyrivibrio]|uniref:ABC transporter substrate-binding protein n=1 Tax=unclassified Butyrivibrio TaxID=2639466 RepID=UPI0003B7A260|nr:MULTISPECIES: ABC transporter substrate-binding protein [unclassified Butyrivibrio]SEL88990.1 putative ABC transport system substrate-binding protein [Butyrivibrio sp. ob235]
MKKKILAMVLSTAMIFSMTGCARTAGGNTTSEPAKTEETAEADTTEAEAADDTAEAEDAAEEVTEEAASEDAEDPEGGKTFHVGVIQLVEHPALDAATKGFEEGLEEALGEAGYSVEFDYQNAQGEQANCATIATKFVNDKDDLIMANATPALQAVAAATGDIPVVGTSITDYKSAGVINDNNAPGTNVTGASDLAPVDEQIALLQKLVPDAKQVGILYCSSEANSKFQVDLAAAALDAAGIGYKEYTVADSNEIQSVVTNAIANSDCLYIPTDNTIADNMSIVKNAAWPAKLPIICGEENMCKNGGLATLSISYYDLGVTAGKQAFEILVNGKNPAEMPIEYVSEGITNEYNPETAEAIEFDDALLDGLTAIDMSE